MMIAPHGVITAVPRKKLIGQVRVRDQGVDPYSGLLISMDHLAILAPGDIFLELQALPLGALGNGIAWLPAEIVDRPHQHIAKNAIFAIQPPAGWPRGLTSINTRAERRIHITAF
jgi:hypothetical protein